MSLAIDTFNKERFGLVTGSKCSVLFPLKGDGRVGQTTYAKQLATEMFFQFYDERSTWEMDHGKMAEHFAFAHYHDYVSKHISEGRWVKKGNCGGTIDAELPQWKGVDFKCPTTLQKWLDYMFEDLSKEQKDQCQMYMYLTGYDEWDIAAYLTETQFMSDNGLTYPVPEKERMIVRTVKRDPLWEIRLEDPLAFVIRTRNEYIKALQHKFNKELVTNLTA
jgi:hypothetical protein